MQEFQGVAFEPLRATCGIATWRIDGALNLCIAIELGTSVPHAPPGLRIAAQKEGESVAGFARIQGIVFEPLRAACGIATWRIDCALNLSITIELGTSVPHAPPGLRIAAQKEGQLVAGFVFLALLRRW